jgi:hypothetical protein
MLGPIKATFRRLEYNYNLIVADAQAALAKAPKSITRIVELLQSTDINVCRNAAYTLSIAAQNGKNVKIKLETNALNACQFGAVDGLLQLCKDGAKKSKKFASEALEKLLNYRILCELTLDLPAKYWLLNHLGGNNLIGDGFYDFGFVGSKLENVDSFPPLNKLSSLPIDKKREVIVIDSSMDPALLAIGSFLAESISGLLIETQIKYIAVAVAKLMGGAIDQDQLSEFNFKFKISELKLRLQSNVIPIGHIAHGTFYHRALLFKALCDRIGLRPCTLVRGDYNRAWNIIDIKNASVVTPKAINSKRVVSSRPKSTQKDKEVVLVMSSADQKALYLGSSDIEGKPFAGDDMAIVDLMFEPGRLLSSQSQEALEYQRQL